MKNRFSVMNILFTLFFIALAALGNFTHKREYNVPNEFYRVYLNGNVIGVITSETELVDMINDEQKEIKNKYGVDEVHLPNGLEISKVVTYSGKIDNVKSVYNRIKETENFTIKAYRVLIKEDKENKKEEKTLYVLRKEDFDKAIKNVALAFIDANVYENYMKGTQEKITDVGEYVEDIKLGQTVTIKPSYVTVTEQIFQTAEELTRYLLFGTLETQKIYKIKSGDTIEKVATKNKLSVDEFIIANPTLKSDKVLLYPGQEVNIALINPVVDIVVLSERTTVQKVAYSTKIQYDYTIAADSTIVKQQGVPGKSKVTFKVEQVNGVDSSVVKTNTVVLSAPVTKIVLRGYAVGGSFVNIDGDWAWPTNSGYVITSNVGYRWGSYHYGLDLAGTGYGSPIYAINDGVVYEQGYTPSMGNYIVIDHKNGYYSRCMHMARPALVRKGETVTKGQRIGSMGNTGQTVPAPTPSNPTAGTHLHIEVWVGGPPYRGRVINPLTLYK